MLLFKNVTIFIVLFFLSGCGFQKVYGTGQKDNISELSKIIIGPISDRNGQILRNNLLFALNTKSKKLKPLYILNLKLSDTTSSLAFSEKSFATRANLRIRAEFTLSRLEDKKSLYSGKSNMTVSFNILKNEYATIAVKKDAMARGLLGISKNIHSQLGVYFMRIQN